MNQRLFIRNWFILVGSNLSAQLFGMLATIRIARALMPEGFGLFNLALTVAAFGSVAVSLGLRNVIIRECARQHDRSGQILASSVMLQSLCLPVVAVVMFLYMRSSTMGVSLELIFAPIVLLLATNVWDLLESISFGYEKMEYSAFINLSGSALWFVAVWSVPVTWVTPSIIIISFVVLQIAKGLAFAFVGNQKGLFEARIAGWRNAVAPMLRNGLPFYWLSILTAATNLLPILFLAERSGEGQVGLYSVGFRLVSPIQMVLSTALAVLYPGLSQAGLNDEERLFRIVRKAFFGLMLLGTACAAGISLFRQDIVSILFGNAYLVSADAMAYQVWYTVVFATLSLIGTTLAALDRQMLLAGLSTCYAVVSLPILWWGAGRGATGLASAIFFAAAINISYHWLFFQRALRRHFPSRDVFMLIAICAVGMSIGFLVPVDTPKFVKGLFLAVIVFIVAQWTLREMSLRAAHDPKPS